MTLKDQLKSIADANKSLGGYTHSKATLRKASLIFTEREAADLDNDTVFDIGFRGFKELCEWEPAVFLPYHSVLFSSAGEVKERGLRTREENQMLDKHLNAFIRSCQVYFTTRPCLQAFEWLIRAFRVNECNIPALVDCALPWHDTDEFVRLVQTFYFTDNGDRYGAFLFTAVKQTGQPVSREFIAKRAKRADIKLIEDAISTYQFLSSLPFAAKQPNPSFISLLTGEFLMRVDAIDGVVLGISYPFIDFLLKSSTRDNQIAGLFLFGVLCERVEDYGLIPGPILTLISDRASDNYEEALLLKRFNALFPGHQMTLGQ